MWHELKTRNFVIDFVLLFLALRPDPGELKPEIRLLDRINSPCLDQERLPHKTQQECTIFHGGVVVRIRTEVDREAAWQMLHQK